MNSYNENLHNSVMSSLSTQEVNRKTIRAQAIASMFTLYHAEAATIDANDKLQHADKDLKLKKKINDFAVSSANISANMFSSATQSNTYMKQSTTNVAVAAANVQVAADAIVKLASDMGGVYSIVNAADFGSDIYDLTSEARRTIGDTAYLAESASRHSMDASIATAEVSAQAILDKAKNSNTSLSNFLATTTNDFNTVSQVVAADTLNVANASVSEQVAEGNFEDVGVEYKAAIKAYNSVNNSLNMNLQVNQIKDLSLKVKNADPTSDVVVSLVPGLMNQDTSRMISFRFLKSAFKNPKQPKDALTGAELESAASYPVQDYYVMVAKDQAKYTFSLTNAENIITNGSKLQYVKLPSAIFQANANELSSSLSSSTNPSASSSSKSSAKNNSSSNSSSSSSSSSVLEFKGKNHVVGVIPMLNSAEVFIDFMPKGMDAMLDTDGDPIQMGINYVVFIFAKYEEKYKRTINSFEDFISAFSPTFVLTNQLQKATIAKYNVTSNSSSSSLSGNSSSSSSSSKPKGAKANAANGSSGSTATGDKQEQTFEFTFPVTEVSNYNVEYRVMFLPVSGMVTTGMMNQSDIWKLETELMDVMKIAAQYDPLIDHYEDLLSNPGITPKEAADYQNKIDTYTQDREAAMDNLISSNMQTVPQPHTYPSLASEAGFVFNLTIAEQVTAGNYQSILSSSYSSSSSSSSSSKSSPSSSAGSVSVSLVPSTRTYSFEFGLDLGTTDIFGNLLEDKQVYMPVILSMFSDSGSNSNAAVFNNAWTGHDAAGVFKIDGSSIKMIPVSGSSSSNSSHSSGK